LSNKSPDVIPATLEQIRPSNGVKALRKAHEEQRSKSPKVLAIMRTAQLFQFVVIISELRMIFGKYLKPSKANVCVE
jgi:hypothetical protein